MYAERGRSEYYGANEYTNFGNMNTPESRWTTK